MTSNKQSTANQLLSRLSRRDKSFLMKPPDPSRMICLDPINAPKSRAEKELFQKQMGLRATLPVMSIKQTSNYWKSFKHTLCVELLSSGFHLTFDEIFNLIRDQTKRISPNEKKDKMLFEEEDKLNFITKYLKEAESAVLAEDFRLAYEARLILAEHFDNDEDKWLSDHFRETCLEVSRQVDTDEGKTYAEGYCKMALALRDNGEYLLAMEKLEWYYELTAGRDWMNEDGVNLHQQASGYLYQIYTFMAMKKKDTGHSDEALSYLQKAHERALEAKNANDIGEAIYKLGLAYLDAKDPDTALEHLKSFMEISENLESPDGIGRAANGIASCYEMKGDIDTCISYLKIYVAIAEKHGLEKAYSNACHHLGSICNSLAIHDEAVEWFSKAYNISRALNDCESLGANRVQFGTALAHKMNVIYMANVEMPNIEGLLKWKSFRAEEFIVPKEESELYVRTIQDSAERISSFTEVGHTSTDPPTEDDP